MQTYKEFIKTAAHGNQNDLIQSKQEQLVADMKKTQSYSEFIKTSGQASAPDYFARREEELAKGEYDELIERLKRKYPTAGFHAGMSGYSDDGFNGVPGAKEEFWDGVSAINKRHYDALFAPGRRAYPDISDFVLYKGLGVNALPRQVEEPKSVSQPEQQPTAQPKQPTSNQGKQTATSTPQKQAPQKQAPQKQAPPAPAPNAPAEVDAKAGGNGSTMPPPATAKGLPWYNGIANWAKNNPELASGSAAALSAVPLYLLGRGFGKKRDRMLGLLTALLGGGAVYYGMKNWGTPWVAGHAQKPAGIPVPKVQKGSNTVMPTNSYGFNPH